MKQLLFIFFSSIIILSMIYEFSIFLSKITIYHPWIDDRIFGNYWGHGITGCFVHMFFTISLYKKQLRNVQFALIQFISISFLAIILPSNEFRFEHGSLLLNGYYGLIDTNFIAVLCFISFCSWSFNFQLRNVLASKRLLRFVSAILLSFIIVCFIYSIVLYSVSSMWDLRIQAHGYQNGFFSICWHICIMGLFFSSLFSLSIFMRKISLWIKLSTQLFFNILFMFVFPFLYSNQMIIKRNGSLSLPPDPPKLFYIYLIIFFMITYWSINTLIKSKQLAFLKIKL